MQDLRPCADYDAPSPYQPPLTRLMAGFSNVQGLRPWASRCRRADKERHFHIGAIGVGHSQKIVTRLNPRVAYIIRVSCMEFCTSYAVVHHVYRTTKVGDLPHWKPHHKPPRAAVDGVLAQHNKIKVGDLAQGYGRPMVCLSHTLFEGSALSD